MIPPKAAAGPPSLPWPRPALSHRPAFPPGTWQKCINLFSLSPCLSVCLSLCFLPVALLLLLECEQSPHLSVFP